MARFLPLFLLITLQGFLIVFLNHLLLLSLNLCLLWGHPIFPSIALIHLVYYYIFGKVSHSCSTLQFAFSFESIPLSPHHSSQFQIISLIFLVVYCSAHWIIHSSFTDECKEFFNTDSSLLNKRGAVLLELKMSSKICVSEIKSA